MSDDDDLNEMSVGPEGPQTEGEKRLGEAIYRFMQDQNHMQGAAEGDPERYRRVNEVLERRGYRAAESEREAQQAEREAQRAARALAAEQRTSDLAREKTRFRWQMIVVTIGATLSGIGVLFAGLAYFAPPEPPVVNVPAPIVTVVAPPPALPPG